MKPLPDILKELKLIRGIGKAVYEPFDPDRHHAFLEGDYPFLEGKLPDCHFAEYADPYYFLIAVDEGDGSGGFGLITPDSIKVISMYWEALEPKELPRAIVSLRSSLGISEALYEELSRKVNLSVISRVAVALLRLYL